MSEREIAKSPGQLSLSTLDDLPAICGRPNYARADLTPGIVHIGLGNFHRAHQAWYLHSLMQQGKALDWAIIGAGVRPYDAAMRDKMRAQDYLTTLIELSPDTVAAEVIGSMIDYLPVEEGHGPLIQQMAQPEIRIVSLTVTEGGYFIDPTTNEFDIDHPDIAHDIAHLDHPKTVFGAIVAAHDLRRQAGVAPFTSQSCDNLMGNGDILRQAVLSIAHRANPQLARWISTYATFPNSMVDCIVPATGAGVIAKAESLGIHDQVPVSHENFRQWVIEDNFCAGRPPWEEVGATLTSDVHPYETMKIRILNAGHQVLANIGEILAVPTIAGCMTHPLIRAFFEKVQRTEIVPYVAPVPGMSPSTYLDLIIKRFSNPAIHDTTRRVAFDGASRHTGFVLPILRDALAAGGAVEGLALVEALWARMCTGLREDGSEIDDNDPIWSTLQMAAKSVGEHPRCWLEQSDIYGDLADRDAFSQAFIKSVEHIWQNGTEHAVQAYIERG